MSFSEFWLMELLGFLNVSGANTLLELEISVEALLEPCQISMINLFHENC